MRRATWMLSWALMNSLLAVAACAQQELSVPQPLPAEQAAKTMKVPEGFAVTLFAAEPDVMQPVGFCIDDRSRLWVAEGYSYPVHR